MAFRILQLTSSSDLGGTERMVLHFLRHVDRETFSVEVGSLVGSGQLTREVEELGFPAWNLGMKKAFEWRAARELLARFRAGRFDLAQFYGLRADALGRPLARISGIRHIISSIRSPDPWRRFHHVLLDRLTSGSVAFWISNSEAGRQSRIRRERFPPRRIFTIPNGIPLPAPELLEPVSAERRREFEQRHGLKPGGGPRVIFIANLRPMKGHLDLLTALPEVLAEFPETVVLCAGRDDSGGAIPEETRRRGLADAVRFIGFVPDTYELLRHGDCAILPSHWEGCPVSVLEAMAMGRPVIATTAGGIPDIVRSEAEGLLIPPGNPEALAQALLRLFRNPDEGNKWAAAARQRAQREFSVEVMTQRIEAVYRILLGNITRAPGL